MGGCSLLCRATAFAISIYLRGRTYDCADTTRTDRRQTLWNDVSTSIRATVRFVAVFLREPSTTAAVFRSERGTPVHGIARRSADRTTALYVNLPFEEMRRSLRVTPGRVRWCCVPTSVDIRCPYTMWGIRNKHRELDAGDRFRHRTRSDGLK